MGLERIFLETEDKVELVGLLSKPNSETNEVIISIHGMQSNCMKKREEILGEQAIGGNIAYFAFNNRGHGLASYVKKEDKSFLEGGSIYENIYDCYYDIKGAIVAMLELGYTKIHLQGHSLGCTKIIYTYNKLKEENSTLLESIESVILLSLVDLPGIQKYNIGEENYEKCLAYANAKKRRKQRKRIHA